LRATEDLKFMFRRFGLEAARRITAEEEREEPHPVSESPEEILSREVQNLGPAAIMSSRWVLWELELVWHY
jgi:hypothetical protein